MPRAGQKRIQFHGAEGDSRGEFLDFIQPFVHQAVTNPDPKQRAALGKAVAMMAAASGAYRAKFGAWPHPGVKWTIKGRNFLAVPLDGLSMIRWALAIEVLAGIDPARDKKPTTEPSLKGERTNG